MTVRQQAKKRAFHRKEKLLLACTLMLGLILILLIPPFDAPDELTHFKNAWAIGHGQAFTCEYWAEGRLMLPSGFSPLMDEYPVRLIGIANQEKCSWSVLFQQSMAYDPSGVMVPAEGRIFSFGYLFSALGMALASAVGSLLGIGWLHSPYIQLLSGRLANWIFFVLVLRAAVRRDQPFRQTLFLLGVMPMTLFLGATLNYDAVLIPVSLWLFATVLSLSDNHPDPLSAPEHGRVLLCVLFLGGTKAPYICLMLLLLLLPRKTLCPPGHPYRCLLLPAAAVIGVVLATVPYLFPVGGAVGYASEQSSWLLAHPFAVPGIILRTLWIDAPSLVIGFWGVFGWLDVHIPRIWLLIGWIVLFGSAVLECCTFPADVRRRKRLPGLIAVILIYSILCVLQYISHAPKVAGYVVGGDHSAGFQGRYLIPCFLPFLLTFANSLLIRKKPEIIPALKKRYGYVSAVWGVCCYLITVFTLLFRYWV